MNDKTESKQNLTQKLLNPTTLKVLALNLVLTLFLDLFLEYSQFKTLEGVEGFVRERTFVFLYNGLIIYTVLSVVLLFRKKIFAYALLGGGWLAVGIANYSILEQRKTPFTAVDLTLIKSILPIINSYLSMWQIILFFFLGLAGIVGLVCLFLYTPEQAKYFDFKSNAMIVLFLMIVLAVITRAGTGKGQLIGRFDNLSSGYQDYGVAYGFCVTALDTGIDRPIEYSRKRVRKVLKKMNTRTRKRIKAEDPSKKREPNIIFIQLESFFDASTVKGLTISEDPIPTFHKLQQETTSGYLKVPVYGAGTINTEFEVITGMNLNYFGTGEYPYRSILHKKTCDSIFYWMRNCGYETSVIHNNNVSFYDRNKVFANLGLENFITMENMDVNIRNEAGWSRDAILTNHIMNTLEATAKTDLIYTISVQGHGDYPTSGQMELPIRVSGQDFTEEELNQYSYYVNQTRDMDGFIAELVRQLKDYPEDVMVIAYGDHLPGMNLETSDLKEGSKYSTPYFIWDNFGYNASHKKKEDGNVTSYQLASKVLDQVACHEGTLNRYHQSMQTTKNYKKNLKLLQYDMLYGSNFTREGKEPLEPSEIVYSLNPPRIEVVKSMRNKYLLIGENFTDYSRVYVNGIRVRSKKLNSTVLLIDAKNMKDKNKIEIMQVSATNENITLNQSEPFEFREENVEEFTTMYTDMEE